MHKIDYRAILLGMMKEDSGRLIHAIAASNELDIFRQPLIMDLIDFRWQKFAARVHIFGMIFHIGYIITQLMYITQFYLREPVYEMRQEYYLLLLAVWLIYPLVYDGE